MLSYMENRKIPIIDLFAGPGGLGEGFSSKIDGRRPFRIGVSVEMEPNAHRTLSLRAFYRYFKHEGRPVPEEYYQYLAGKIERKDLEHLFMKEWRAANAEALCAELGKDEPDHQQKIDRKISTVLKNKKDWVLIGGPPCQAYSQIGRSCRVGMLNSKHGKGNEEAARKQFEEDPKHVLYQQYLRIIAKHGPAVFVMENVKGILSSKLDGKKIFPQILQDLRDPFLAAQGYDDWGKVKKHKYRIVSFVTGEEPDGNHERDYLIESEKYGIPQTRHRVILLGIRQDIFKKIGGDITPLQEKEPTLVRQIIKGLPPLRSGFSADKLIDDSLERWNEYFRTLSESSWCESVEPKVRIKLDKALGKLSSRKLNRRYIGSKSHPIDVLGGWFSDERLIGLPNHETRTHQDSDLARYLFVSAYGDVKKRSPRLADFPDEALPEHKNINKNDPKQGFKDRLRVQVWTEPAKTITCHIASDGHYYIHPDPSQCRALTVREAARIQTFPDNYFFEGGRRSSHKRTGDGPRYRQVGNAVPPYLAKQLATIVWDIFQKAGK